MCRPLDPPSADCQLAALKAKTPQVLSSTGILVDYYGFAAVPASFESRLNAAAEISAGGLALIGLTTPPRSCSYCTRTTSAVARACLRLAGVARADFEFAGQPPAGGAGKTLTMATLGAHQYSHARTSYIQKEARSHQRHLNSCSAPTATRSTPCC